jgi:valyl-tRNA synthetase
MSSTQDVRFSLGMVEEGRWLANKLWNISRLLLSAEAAKEVALRPTSVEERWILARLDATRANVEEHLAAFDFAHAVKALYGLTRDDFCDWYAEAIKPRLYDGDEDAAATALAALERLLKLLHPVMPHVTEEIWTNLPARETRLILAPWPEPDGRFAPDVEALERVQDVARIFRRSGVLVELEGDERRIFEAVVRPDRVRANGNASAEVERVRNEIVRAERMLGNERFVQNAPPEVVDEERDKLARYRRELDALGG